MGAHLPVVCALHEQASGKLVRSTVGAVYDRAFSRVNEIRAVTDRAYKRLRRALQ